jgi:hypothetical protein
MTSEAKTAANRRNARRSTGPRTTAGKTRVRRNALRHGLAAVVFGDPAMTAEVDRIAVAMCAEHANPLEREQALIMAEAQVTLKRIRRARAQMIEQLSVLPLRRPPDAQDTAPIRGGDRRAPCLDQLLGLERYERRAFSQRKRAVREPLA